RRTEPNVMFRLWPLRYVLPHAAARSTETSLSSVWTVVARKPSPGSHAAATVTTRSSVVEWLGRQTLGHSEWRRQRRTWKVQSAPRGPTPAWNLNRLRQRASASRALAASSSERLSPTGHRLATSPGRSRLFPMPIRFWRQERPKDGAWPSSPEQVRSPSRKVPTDRRRGREAGAKYLAMKGAAMPSLLPRCEPPPRLLMAAAPRRCCSPD